MKKFSTILFILIWFSVSIFGERNSSVGAGDEEIGRPIIKGKAGYIDSAAIAPNRKSFYTLKDGKITYWKMNPIKPIDSLQLDVNTTNKRETYHIYLTQGGKSVIHQGHKLFANDRQQKYTINISQDSKRVIFHSYTQIQLWDLQSKKLLKIIDEPSRLVTTYKNNFITITGDNHLKIWDDKSFKLLREKNLGKRKVCNDYSNCYYSDLINIFAKKDLLYLYEDSRNIFVDFNTLKIVDEIYGKMSLQEKNKYSKKYADIFPITFWRRSIENNYYYASISTHNEKNELLRDGMQIKQRGKNSYTYLLWVDPQKEKRKKSNRYIIYQFNDAWLVLSRRGWYFTGSKNVRKYLKMKTKDGKIVPMNDATFQKYSKTISIGEKR